MLNSKIPQTKPKSSMLTSMVKDSMKKLALGNGKEGEEVCKRMVKVLAVEKLFSIMNNALQLRKKEFIFSLKELQSGRAGIYHYSRGIC